jgi:hypothetical protein
MRSNLFILALVAALAVIPSVSGAAPNNRFLVPGNDGYGIGECLAEGGACGQAVAGSYCEAQGFKQGALSYSNASKEITATTVKRGPRPSAFVIECRT